jgi:hypothetical protein
MSSDGPSFWVFFDTATKRDYYADVHKLLALPGGALIRYDYRDLYLGDGVKDAIRSSHPPRPVLVVYAQWDKYVRGDEAPGEGTALDEMSWQAMRLGELEATWESGDNNYFQFRVTDYPAADPSAVEPIVSELATRGEGPYRKWVALSAEADALKGLKSTTPEEEWTKIVSRLGTPPMQFQGDVFWRVDPPARAKWRRGTALRNEYKPSPSPTPEKVHRWVVPEQSVFAIPVTMREPAVAAYGDGAARIKLEAPEDGPLHAPHPDSVDLRRNATVQVTIESKHTAKSERKLGSLRVRSEASIAPPMPESLTLDFAVSLARWKQVLGGFLVVVAIAGAAVTAISSRITTSTENLPWAVIAAVAVVLVGALGALLYTGRLPVKT